MPIVTTLDDFIKSNDILVDGMFDYVKKMELFGYDSDKTKILYQRMMKYRKQIKTGTSHDIDTSKSFQDVIDGKIIYLAPSFGATRIYITYNFDHDQMCISSEKYFPVYSFHLTFKNHQLAMEMKFL